MSVEGFVAFILARPRTVVGCILVLSAVFAAELRHLDLRVSLRDLTPRHHPYRGVDDHIHQLTRRLP